MAFKIGDRVKVSDWDGICEITDIMFSNKFQRNMYEVSPEGESKPPIGVYEEFALKPVAPEKQFRFCVDIADNVVITTMEEQVGDDLYKVIARGHGHLIHDGEAGLAQAFSYAARRLWCEVDSDCCLFNNGRNK